MNWIHSFLRTGISRRVSGRAWYLASVGLVLAISAWYLWGANQCAGVGFPLDDPWIHQTYARNLARTGRLVYTGDQVSAGSTSPLWTLLLSLGHLVGIAPLPAAYGLGVLGWLGLAWASAALTRQLFPEKRGVALLVGLACLFEWHLAWAALSGMEITLFTLLSLLLIERYVAGVRPVWVGLIGGLLVWARPEGILLVGLLIGAGAIERLRARRRDGVPARLRRVGLWKYLLAVGIGFAALFVPYVALNVLLWGRPLPATFYAKHAEYQTSLARPIWDRLWEVAWLPLVGAQLLLVPGFVWQAAVGLWQMVRTTCQPLAKDGETVWRRDVRVVGDAVKRAGQSPSVFALVLPIAWWVAYHLVYALRLPVGYQHGRYLMPTIPLVLVYGIVGTAQWVRRSKGGPDLLIVRVLKRALVLSICCLFVAFVILGGRTYADDVCIIQGEMVDVALWLRANTPPGALVATHDIGAIGYFAERPLLDLAGLVTPKVIPFVRDERRLLDYLLGQDAEYVVTFPAWYPNMVNDDRLTLVYQTDCAITREKLGDNMAVYRVTH